MRHALVKVVGFVLTGLLVIGLVFTVVTSALKGKPFYGVNYYGLDLPTYSTLATIAAAMLIGIYWAGRQSFRWMRRRQTKIANDH